MTKANVKISLNLSNRDLSFECGKIAKFADGAVVARYGDTMVLATVVVSEEKSEEWSDIVPLTVDYREKTYAAGKIPGGFFKREGRPTEKEILTSRMIDRPIRPLFPKGVQNEIQLMAMVLSADESNDPDVVAINAASAAIAVSGVSFKGPLAAVRIGRVDKALIVNPTLDEVDKGSLDMVVAGTPRGIVMVEGFAWNLEEKIILDALDLAQKNITIIASAIQEFAAKSGADKRELEIFSVSGDLMNEVKKFAWEKITKVTEIPDKEKREEYIAEFTNQTLAHFSDRFVDKEIEIKCAISEIEREVVRERIINEELRADNRKADEIRPISIEVGLLPRTHGSALFTRGQTQSLAVVTLGTSSDEQILDELVGESSKSFMLHYNFPPFSVGEIRPIRGPGRREIGHGALAERSIIPVLPKQDKFPYTIRIVSDILESNGSSSMASVCGGTLALMDAGVPITAPVAGIAMGLIKEQGKTRILTDIAGLEDHFGDMDFKLSGTRQGITGLQMDIKIEGLDRNILVEALEKARRARNFVLDKMAEVIKEPKKNISEYAPRIAMLKIPKEKIGDVIGSGGRTIKGIIESTGAKIDIDDEGVAVISSSDDISLNRAFKMVKDIITDPEVGKIYTGKVKKVMEFGAFIEILPGREGLCHISQLAPHRVNRVEDVVREGDEVTVKITEIDRLGRISLSRKQALVEKNNP
jgi:polyribonucleotide nucleotidyltransferase